MAKFFLPERRIHLNLREVCFFSKLFFKKVLDNRKNIHYTFEKASNLDKHRLCAVSQGSYLLTTSHLIRIS